MKKRHFLWAIALMIGFGSGFTSVSANGMGPGVGLCMTKCRNDFYKCYANNHLDVCLDELNQCQAGCR